MEIATEHPHIVRIDGASGSEPHIRGTGIAVRHMVNKSRMGADVQDILRAYPHLSAAQVHDALSYYYDHQEEIEHFIRINTEEHWKGRNIPNAPFTADGKERQ